MQSAPEAAAPDAAARRHFPAPLLSVIGCLIGAWGAMCGIGGGLFAVPVLHYLCKLPLKSAVATALGLVMATTTASTLFEAFHPESRIVWPLVGCMIAGSLVGAQLGFWAVQRIKTLRLKLIFAVVLLVVGVRIILREEASGEVVAVAIAGLTWGTAAYSALVGLAAGFLAPVLGIGGGLVAVPGMVFGIEGLGHLGARACSLGMGSVTSMRSFWLWLKTGKVSRKDALWLGLGAAVGSGIGVQLVHYDDMAGVASKMLGATLVFVACRFALDVHKARQAA